MKTIHRTHIFPYERVAKGANIILWGAGKIGRQYYLQSVLSGFCNIVAVVDTNAENICDFPTTVSSLEVLTQISEFDYVVIAVGDKCSREGIMNELLSHDIPATKIVPYRPNHSYCEYVSVPREGVDYDFLRNVQDCLRICQTKGHSLVRIGNAHDGGYIMLNDFRPGAIAYSFGINDDVTWDEEIADKGIDVFMYDHTIDELPRHRKEFHFFKRGIASDTITKELDTLENFIETNGHGKKKHMILKMDVEGAEWGFLEMTPSDILKQFDQIILEIHCLLKQDIQNKIISALHKINETHAAVHVHANNCATVFDINGCEASDAMEVTWANKDTYNLIPANINLPLEIDAPCQHYLPEVKLGHWNAGY